MLALDKERKVRPDPRARVVAPVVAVSTDVQRAKLSGVWIAVGPLLLQKIELRPECFGDDSLKRISRSINRGPDVFIGYAGAERVVRWVPWAWLMPIT